MSGQPGRSGGLAASMGSISMSSGGPDASPSGAYSLSAQLSGGPAGGSGVTFGTPHGAGLAYAQSAAVSVSLHRSGGSGSFALQPAGGSAVGRLPGADGSAGSFSVHTPTMGGSAMGAGGSSQLGAGGSHLGGSQLGGGGGGSQLYGGQVGRALAGASGSSVSMAGHSGEAGGGGLASRGSGALSHYGSNALSQLGSGALPRVRALRSVDGVVAGILA